MQIKHDSERERIEASIPTYTHQVRGEEEGEMSSQTHRDESKEETGSSAGGRCASGAECMHRLGWAR